MSVEINSLFGLIWLLVVIWAIVKVVQSSATPLSKALWIVILLLLPVVGFIIWWLVGPK
ncbi:PLDc N-terminal domain-containing protein [Rhodocyclaceae bacterium SMB388]